MCATALTEMTMAPNCAPPHWHSKHYCFGNCRHTESHVPKAPPPLPPKPITKNTSRKSWPSDYPGRGLAVSGPIGKPLLGTPIRTPKKVPFAKNDPPQICKNNKVLGCNSLENKFQKECLQLVLTYVNGHKFRNVNPKMCPKTKTVANKEIYARNTTHNLACIS